MHSERMTESLQTVTMISSSQLTSIGQLPKGGALGGRLVRFFEMDPNKEGQQTGNGKQMVAKGNGGNGGGRENNNKKCGHCGKKGHSKDKCWKKHPENAPQWFKDLKERTEASSSNVEIMMASIELENNKNYYALLSDEEDEEPDFSQACQDVRGSGEPTMIMERK